jgi:glycosyltransferase involved in cell wall biosynthesis
VTGRLIPLQSARFAIVTNGFVGGGAAHAMRDFLVARKAGRLVTVFHPLTREDVGRHEMTIWEKGVEVRKRSWTLPSRPPFTFPLDLVTPISMPEVDCWFGFNALACWRGIRARKAGRTQKAVYWCVDFVRARFGAGQLTRFYEYMDGFCSANADFRFDISQAAAEARNARHAKRRLAPVRIVPIGAWLDRMATTPPDGYRSRRVIYAGNLVRTQGGPMLLAALALLGQRNVQFTAEIVGRGPLLEELQAMAKESRIDDRIHFHGYVDDHRDVERIVASGAVGMAPYDSEIESFTRWADPGKLKTYLAAGLPIIVTDVPPNAKALAEAGAAVIAPFQAEGIADAIEQMLADGDEWQRRRQAALNLAKDYDWTTILSGALETAGFQV